jgi:hypothetical protein
VLIVAQNLFIARLLVSLSEAHKSVSSYKVIVFSSTEKFILNKLHGVYKINITSPSDVSQNIQLDSHVECIENKRGTFSHDIVKRLQCVLLNMLASQEISDFEYIWIFNEHTFIGSFLKNSQEYAPKCVVFENSNQNNGVTILGDVFGKSGEDMRNLFLDPQNFLSSIIRIRRPKFYRMITLPFHIRSAQALNYYFKRILVRAFNVISFFFIKHKNRLLKHKKIENPIILIALQIKDDSAVAMNIDFDEYCNILMDAAMKFKTENPRSIVWVRPHPRDYTLGWLSFYNFTRWAAPYLDASLDMSEIEDIDERNVTHLITYNSNIIRHARFANGNINVICFGKNHLLPPFSEDILQINRALG